MGATKQAKEKRLAKKVAGKEARKAAKEELRKREIVATRNVAARQVLSNAIVKEKKPRINWYLVELLDPSRWEEAIAHGLRGIPDFYSHRGHIFCTRTIFDLDSSNFDGDGKCNVLVQPSLNKHVARSVDSTSRLAYQYSRCEAAGDALGFFTGSNEDAPAYDFFNQNYNMAAAGSRILYPESLLLTGEAAGDDGTNQYQLTPYNTPSTRVGNHGDYRFKLTAAANNLIRVDFFLKNPFASGVTGNVTIAVTTDAGTHTTNLAAVAGHSSGSFFHTMDAAASELYSVSLVNNTNGAMAINAIDVTAYLNRPASYTNLLYTNAQNYERIAADFTAYRPVCGYLWPKYRGDLTKNGNIAGALIDSAATPAISGTAEYSALAGLLQSYEGSVTQGGYGIWTPMNPADTNFTPITAERPGAPFLMAALDVNEAAAQTIRVEVFFVWEALTQLQTYAPEPGSVDIGMMNDAFEKLAHFPKFMENENHLKSIAGFLSGVMRKGGEYYSKAMANPESRSAVMSAARLLMSKAQQYGPTVANAARIALAAAGTL